MRIPVRKGVVNYSLARGFLLQYWMVGSHPAGRNPIAKLIISVCYSFNEIHLVSLAHDIHSKSQG